MFAGIPNPDRMQELIAVFDQYKDPGTNILDANNPDYLAAIDAINQKYADNMFMTPQQLQDANFPGMIQQASTGDTTSTTDDPLSMGSNQGALGNLDDDVELSSLNTTFEEDVLPAGAAVSESSQTTGTESSVTGDEYGFDQFGMPIYYGENQDLDGDGRKDDVITSGRDSSVPEGEMTYDMFVEESGVPVVDGYAIFDSRESMSREGGFYVTGESPNSQGVYVDDEGNVRRYDNTILDPEVYKFDIESIKQAHDDFYTEDYYKPVQIYSNFAENDPLLENSDKFGTLGGILAQSVEQSGNSQISKYTDKRDYEFNPQRHQIASAIFRNDAGDVLQYNFVGKRAGEFSYDRRPSSLEGYKLVSGTFRNNTDDKDTFRFDVPEEFQDYDYTNAFKLSPTLLAELAAEQRKDDKSDNDIWYVDPDGNTRVDVTGTGFGIPVGSTHIGLYNAHSDSKNNTVSQGANFQQFAFTKGTDGFYVTGSDTDPFKDNMVESGEYNQLGVDSDFLDEYKFGESSQYGAATSSFMDTVTNEEGKFEFSNQPYDIGAALGFDAGKFVLSSFPSDQINLEPFMTARGTAGSDAQFLYNQMDKLPNYKKVLDYLTGKISYEDIDFDTLDFFGKDGSITIDTENLTGYMNEYLSGKDSEGTDSAIFSNTFEQTTSTDNVPIDDDDKNDDVVIDDDDDDDDDDDTPVKGCTEKDANNYNPEATEDDGSCTFDPGVIKGCTDPFADNYDPEATSDDGSCTFDGGVPPMGDEPFVVRAYKGGGVGPFARNYIFQRFGYTPTETIDLLLNYDPLEGLYFFEDGSPVDPEFLDNMQLTRLDDQGQVVRDEDGNAVRMPKVVINNEEEE